MFRLRTIYARLLVGFGTSITLLMVAGLLGYLGLERTNVQSRDTIDRLASRSESTERTITTVMRELVAGLRYLNTRAPEDADRYQQLVSEADSLRRQAIQQGSLRSAERKVLENVGQIQSAMEVRIAMTHAYQVVGREADASRILSLTTKDIDEVEVQLAALREAAREGTRVEFAAMSGDLRTNEIALGIVVVLAFMTAAFFGVTTSTAVTVPLVTLRNEMNAIGSGDLRLPDASARSRHAFAEEYADLDSAMQQARERLRTLLTNVQDEADQVTLAAGELSSSASAAAASSQHVTCLLYTSDAADE